MMSAMSENRTLGFYLTWLVTRLPIISKFGWIELVTAHLPLYYC